MTWKQLLGAFCLGLAMGGHASAQQPLLQLQGEPYFGGSLTLHVTAPTSIGKPVLLLLGLDPLAFEAPAWTGKGPLYIGNLLSVLPFGAIGSNGRLDVSLTLPPPVPGVKGLPIVMQAYVPWQLSNPATLPLDIPYFKAADALTLASPQPQIQANFGDTLTAGDLNSDGYEDLIVGAWFEDWQGIDKSGRVYVFWGPEFIEWTGLQSAEPKVSGHFGCGVAVSDLDNDGMADLIVAETAGESNENESGWLHIYWGGISWVATPGLHIASAGTGILYSLFGRSMTIGDYDADGWRDIAVGIDRAIVGGVNNAGRIDVYWGPAYQSRTEITSPDNGVDNFFGYALSSGDATGDGIDDLIEGSGRDDVNGITNLGSAHVYVGPALQWFATLAAPIPSGFNTRFGDAVEVLATGVSAGASIVVFDLKNHGFVYTPGSFANPLVVSKPVAGSQVPVGQTVFGGLLATGDVNADGRVDLLVSDFFEGSLLGCAPLSAEGRLYISLAPYFSTFHLLKDVNPHCGDQFGWRSIAADLDRDGRNEVIVGAITSDFGNIQNSGNVVIFRGK